MAVAIKVVNDGVKFFGLQHSVVEAHDASMGKQIISVYKEPWDQNPKTKMGYVKRAQKAYWEDPGKFVMYVKCNIAECGMCSRPLYSETNPCKDCMKGGDK